MCWWQVLFRFVASESRQKNRDLEAAASDNIYHSNSNLDHDWLQSRILSCDWSTRKKSVISQENNWQENIWNLSEWHWKNSRGHLNLPCFPSSIMRASKLIMKKKYLVAIEKYDVVEMIFPRCMFRDSAKKY